MSRRAVRLLALAAALAAVACTACAGARGRAGGPRDAIGAYLEAVDRDDPRAAYALLGHEQRKLLSYDEFEARWRAHAVERKAQARALRETLARDRVLGERATLTFRDGRSTELVREERGWRVEVPLLSPLRAHTPREAVRQLVLLAETGALEGLLRVLSTQQRERMRQHLEHIRAHVDDEIEVAADRAFLRFTEGKRFYKITLIREDGEWRIDDIDF